MLQEIDVKTGLVMFQWSSLDHVGLSESYEPARSLDHELAVRLLPHQLDRPRAGRQPARLRSQHLDVYDVDAHSGQIVWRLGGKRSSFTMAPGTRTAWQHDARELANGSISIFDNGASPTVHSQSRGIVVSLDPQQKDRHARQPDHPYSRLLAESQGNMQALANGDWFLGWGQVPDFSEFNAAGQLLFDAHFPHGTQSYRDFRFTWTGMPVHPPAFVLQTAAHAARDRLRELERRHARGRLEGAVRPQPLRAHADRAVGAQRL